MASLTDFGLKQAIRFDVGRAIKEAAAHLNRLKAKYASEETSNTDESEAEMLNDAQLLKWTIKALLQV